MQASESKLHREVDQEHRKAVSLVRKTSSDCWEKATGKHQVPYKAIKEGKYKLEVKNLPSGVKFRDPCCMGLKTPKSIMSVKDIEIIVLSQPSNAPHLEMKVMHHIHSDLDKLQQLDRSSEKSRPSETETETAGPEQLENEAIIPSQSGTTETAQQSNNEAMIPPLSEDVVDILLGAVGSSEFPESNEVSIELSSSKIFEVQQILQRRKRGRRKEVLIRWKNFDMPTWEPEENLVS